MTPASIAIVMRTVDRTTRNGRRNFLGQTLDNLARGGVFKSALLHSFHLIDTGGSENYPDREIINMAYVDDVTIDRDVRWLIRLHRAPAGTVRTPNEAATLAHDAGLESGAAWTLFCEDDIDVCGSFLESIGLWLDEHAKYDAPFYVFGANYGQIGQAVAQRKTCWSYPLHAFYGTQCYAVSRDRASRLVPWLKANPLHAGKVTRCHDLRLQNWVKTEPRRRDPIASAPCFVDHVGVESSLGNKHFGFASWPGHFWSYTARQEVTRS